MGNKKRYKAIIRYIDYSEKLKGYIFKVCMLYSIDGEIVDEFKLEKTPIAVLKDLNPDQRSMLPEGVTTNYYFEVCVENVNKDSLSSFDILPDSSFEQACILYNNSWIRKKDNLFVSTNGVVVTCKKLGWFIPFDKDESCMYSEITLGENDAFVSKDGTIRKFKLENLDILTYAYKREKNVYVISKSIVDNVKKELVEEIDFIDKEKLKEWFIKSCDADQEELNNLLTKINNDILDEASFNIRLERCRKMFESFTFSKDDLSWFFNRKKFKKEIDDYKQYKRAEIDKEITEEKDKKLKELQDCVDSELKKKIEGVKQELDKKEKLIKEKETELTSLQCDLNSLRKDVEVTEGKLALLTDEVSSMETTKGMIIEALKEEIRSQQLIMSNDVDKIKDCLNDTRFFKRSSDVPEVEDDNYRVLFPSDFDKSQREALAEILVHKASVIPNVSYAYALAHFMSNTDLKIITVEHGWYHYQDFVEAGILEFYNRALADKENNYLLVLENINIVPIECALKPLLNLINGTRLDLPGAAEPAFPKNLRILATVLPSASDEDFGIKLNEYCYSGFNFVETPKSKLPLPLYRILNISPRRYVTLNSVEITGIDDDNGYSRYKDY